MHVGDGTRAGVLDAAGAATARAIVVATDDPETTLRIARMVQVRYAGAALMVRAHDRIQAVRLAGAGIPAGAITRETVLSALALGEVTLQSLGYSMDDARGIVARVQERVAARLADQVVAGRDAAARDAIVAAIAPEPLSSGAEK